MEAWRKVFREGVLPHVSRAALARLRGLLVTDDARLLQGATTIPPPLMCVQDWPCESADSLGTLMAHDNLYAECDPATVGQVEEGFATLCFKVDQTLGEPAACRWFINWFDECPRDEMRREMIAEIDLALSSQEAM